MTTCKEGFTVTIVSSKPELEKRWKKLNGFGIGSEVHIKKILGEEAIVTYENESGAGEVTVPITCLSCNIDPENAWEGSNRELIPIDEEDSEKGQPVFVPVIRPDSETEFQEERQHMCSICGSIASSMDTICTICGSTLPPFETDLLGEVPAPEPEESEPSQKDLIQEAPAEERVCPSCGAFVEADATECMICETPMSIVQQVPAKTPEPMPVEDISEEPKTLVEEISEDIQEPAPVAQEEEKVCPACGAFVEADATECMICETPISAAPIPIPVVAKTTVIEEKVPEKAPEPIEIPQETPEPVPLTQQEDKICPSCGAFAEPDATQCMICDTPLITEKPALDEDFSDLEPAPMPTNKDVEVAPVEEPIPEEAAPEKEIAATEEIAIGENEIVCPSCSKAIPAESATCPECWTDLSLYVKCPSCGLLSPAGERLCRECFAPLGEIESAETADTEALDLEEASDLIDVSISEVVEITEELKEEMKSLESQEEQGKECLVCGAIFGPEDMLCPVCGIEYGIEVEEPTVPEPEWGHIEVEVPPTIRTCPNCGSNVTGLDATEREVKEGKWFYRGLITIFTGIFFTSFSIWARGISVENESLGLNPPPTDVVLNLFGWILVLLGFVFWFMSWRLHGERTECPECGIETEPDMTNCINCGVVLSEEAPEEESEEPVEEEEAPKEDTNYLDTLKLPPRRHADMPVRKKEPVSQPEPEIQEEPEMEIPELEVPEEEVEIPAKPEIHSHGEELPVEHLEHKKCPGCGIFVDLDDKICPVCDTEFAQEPEKVEPGIDNITIPDSSAPHIECPSCGADVQAGTKSCPVCEYPLE